MTPDTHPFDVVYVAAQIGWVLAFVVLLIALVIITNWGHARIRRRYERPRPRIHTHPRRDATVHELRRDGWGAR